MLRRRIYEIIEVAGERDKLSGIYDVVIMTSVCLNLIPLAFKSTNPAFDVIGNVTGIIFVVDYILRLITADYKLNAGISSFFRYPFTPLAIIDLISILPSFTPLTGSLRFFKGVRILRTLRIVRFFKMFRYSHSLSIITNVIKHQKTPLLAVCALACTYVIVAALVIFNVEPGSFDTFFDAIYWAVISLTTVGYGDLYPITTAGRVVAMISAFFGIAIVALPAGIITAGYMDELNLRHEEEKAAEAAVLKAAALEKAAEAASLKAAALEAAAEAAEKAEAQAQERQKTAQSP